MFTGIVEEIGTIEKIQRGSHSAVLTIRADKILEDISLGNSIAVNGVCLTVTSFTAHDFTVDVMHETLNRSSLTKLQSGSHVNLERAMPADGRFGGHIVAGHVDGVGKIVEIRRDDIAVWYTIQAEPSVLRYIIEKGSVAIDGISLTVAQVYEDRFSISAIPHTIRETILSEKRVGDLVNLENDMLGKYVERLLQPATTALPQSSITKEFLARCGY
ncbi:MAG: riboflavin synthase [Lachnospiraceae bacterium]|nr:riboflavin synthase [Lachnospiraceae bacterium]